MNSISDKKPSISPVFVIAIGILAVSTASIFIRYAQGYSSSIVIAAYRLTLSSLILVPIVLRSHKGELKRLKPYDIGLGILSGIFLAIHFASWISSLEYTTITSSVVIVSTSPMWVAVLSPLILREPLKKIVLIGLVVALIGGLIIGLGETCQFQLGQLTCQSISAFMQENSFLGNSLALIGAFSGAGYMLIGRKLRVNISLIVYISLVYGIAAIGLVIMMFVFGESPFGYPPSTYLWFLLLALIPQLLGHSSFNWALGYLPAAFVSITLLGEPIGSSILAFVILKEIPSLFEIFGAILILIGIYIASRENRAQSLSQRN